MGNKQKFEIEQLLKLSSVEMAFEASYDSGFYFAGETHPFWECVYVIDGSICASADDKIYNMNAGELIFHKPLELHKLSVTGNKPATIFIFSYSAVGELCDFFEGKTVNVISNKINSTLLNNTTPQVRA